MLPLLAIPLPALPLVDAPLPRAVDCLELAAEGQVHKRQRRVATPAFSIQNLRALVPEVFGEGVNLKNKWMSLIKENTKSDGSLEGRKLDVCDWISRATFDVIGSAGMFLPF